MLYRTVKPLVVDAVQTKEPGDISVRGGVLHVNAGDWIIRDNQNNLVRCSDSEFKSTYEALDMKLSLEDLLEGKPCGC